jgi:hypothetical protein
MSKGVDSLDMQKRDRFGLNKRARLDNQRQPEQYSPRLDLLINPTFPYRTQPLDPAVFFKVSSESVASQIITSILS